MIKIDRRVSLGIYVITLVTAFVFRIMQWKTSINIRTGFFIGSDFLKNSITITLLIGTILFALMLIVGSSENKGEKINRYNADAKLIRNTPQILYGCLALTVTLSLFDFRGITENNSIGLFSCITAALQGVCIIVFACTAITELLGKPFMRGNGYAYLIPTVWVALRAAILFKNSSSIVSNSQNLLKLVYLLFAILFFVYTARFFAGYERKHTRKIVLLSAMLTSILGLITVVPIWFYADSVFFEYDKMCTLADMFISLFAAGTMLKLLGADIVLKTETKPVSEENTEEKTEE